MTGRLNRKCLWFCSPHKPHSWSVQTPRATCHSGKLMKENEVGVGRNVNVEFCETVVWEYTGFLKHNKETLAWQGGRGVLIRATLLVKAVGTKKLLSAFFSLITGVLLTYFYRIYRNLASLWLLLILLTSNARKLLLSQCLPVSECLLLCKNFWKLTNWFNQIWHRLRVSNNNYAPTSFAKIGSQREEEERPCKISQGKGYSKQSLLISHWRIPYKPHKTESWSMYQSQEKPHFEVVYF